jgi:serine protease AprX
MRMLRRCFAIGLVVAVGVPVGATASSGSQPPASTGTVATRASLAEHRLVDAHNRPLDGRGTTIAVIDTGVDPTHPAFALPGGGTKIVRTLSALPCLRYGEGSPWTQESSDDPSCLVDVPAGTTSDAGHGGHGSFVSGVAVGDHFTLPDGTKVGGAAPGARVLMISATTALVGIDNAFRWIVQNHRHPCGKDVRASVCPPIRVVNCSWGADDPTITRAQDALARAGVLTVWANGNAGGDGSTSNSNVEATADRTPGILAVGSYDDLGTGTRHGRISPSSSEGAKTDPRTWPDISAPGVNIISACRLYQPICPAIETAPPRDGPGPGDNATYFIGSGTSFAAPEVCGVVALLFQVNPRASAALIERTLERTAYRVRDGAPYQRVRGVLTSYDKGTGLVDAYAAARALGAHRGLNPFN